MSDVFRDGADQRYEPPLWPSSIRGPFVEAQGRPFGVLFGLRGEELHDAAVSVGLGEFKGC